MIIDFNDNLWMFGYNEEGQLGLGDKINRSTPTKIHGLKVRSVAGGTFHTIAIDLNSNVWVN
jgi:alpha-tubulin suppressor-like RCC1 family protein